jgi:hypothetical protein
MGSIKADGLEAFGRIEEPRTDLPETFPESMQHMKSIVILRCGKLLHESVEVAEIPIQLRSDPRHFFLEMTFENLIVGRHPDTVEGRFVRQSRHT